MVTASVVVVVLLVDDVVVLVLVELLVVVVASATTGRFSSGDENGAATMPRPRIAAMMPIGTWAIIGSPRNRPQSPASAVFTFRAASLRPLRAVRSHANPVTQTTLTATRFRMSQSKNWRSTRW